MNFRHRFCKFALGDLAQGMTFKAILFDLDGTLLDSLTTLGTCMNQVLESKGHPTHPIDAYRHFVGEGVGKLVERALPAGATAAEVASGVDGMREAYQAGWNIGSHPYPGIEDMLRELETIPVKRGILSNKPEDFTCMIMKTLFSDFSFDPVRGAREGVPLKPDPSSALAVIEAWGIEPQEVLYVGDTSTDMQTAVAAGMFGLGVTWGFREEAELRATGAHAIVDTPAEILDCLRKSL